MKRSVSIWFVALLLVIWGGYTLWTVATLRRWDFAPAGALAPPLGCGGLLRDQPWSGPVVHLLTVLAIGRWSYAVWRVAYLGWPYSDVLSTSVSLVPGIVFVAAWVGSSFVVSRHFRIRN